MHIKHPTNTEYKILKKKKQPTSMNNMMKIYTVECKYKIGSIYELLPNFLCL